MDDVPAGMSKAVDNPYINCTWIQLHDALIDKDHELQCMADQLSQLSVLEAENERKSEVISELRKELTAHRKNSWSKDVTYVSMEEHLASCESHLQERMAEVKSLQKQLEDCKRQLQSAESRRSSLQKQLHTKDSAMAKHKEEAQRLQQQSEAALGSLGSVRQECRDKQRSIAALQEKIKRLKEENQDLQKRLEVSQAAGDELAVVDQKSKAELSKAKGYIATMKQLQARCQFLEEETAKTKERENELACKLGKKGEEMSSLCQQLLALTSSGPVECGSCSPEAVVQAVSPLVEQNAELHGQLQALTEQLEQIQDKLTATCDDATSVAHCLNGFQDSSQAMEVASAMETALQSLDGIQCETLISSLKANVFTCIKCVHSHMTELSTKWTELLQQLTSECKALGDEGEKDPLKMVSSIAAVACRKTTECQALQERLAQKELEHSATISGALAAMKLDEESKVAQAVNQAKSEEQNRFRQEMDSIRQQMEAEKDAALSKQEEITRATAEELEHAKETISQLETKTAEREEIDAQLVSLEAKLSELEEASSQALSLAEIQKETLRQKLLEEVSGYKEKSEQYALTIVALEDKLLPLAERQQVLERENAQLREEQLADEVKEGSADGITAAAEASCKVEKLDKLTSVLRHQLVLASQEHSKQEAKMIQLENNLETAKKELQDREATLREEISIEIADLTKSLSAQEELAENQRLEIERLTQLLAASATAETQQLKSAEETQLGADNQHSMKEPDVQLETTRELLRAGERCIGERHAEIIGSQKEAISQLKEGLTDAMRTRPPGRTHQATLRELTKAREELLKGKAHVQPVSGGEDRDGTTTSAGKEPTEALDFIRCSEQSYEALVDTLCAGLPIEKPHGSGVLPMEGNMAIWNQALRNRQKFADKVSRILTSSSGHLRDRRLQRQDSGSGSSISGDGPGGGSGGDATGAKVDTSKSAHQVAELEAQLAVTVEELEQQRRLNHALLRRKNFKEVLLRKSSAKPKHKCTVTS